MSSLPMTPQQAEALELYRRNRSRRQTTECSRAQTVPPRDQEQHQHDQFQSSFQSPQNDANADATKSTQFQLDPADDKLIRDELQPRYAACDSRQTFTTHKELKN
eukprot:SAG31_NODE_451_length_15511_cov_77.547301_8_plen_105_part_00